MTVFHHYSSWGAHLGRLADVGEPKRRAVVNGEDTLTLETPTLVAYGDRLLWFDGEWHEHVVTEFEKSHGGSYDVTATAAWQYDLRHTYVEQFLAYNVTAEFALGELLKVTPWAVGEIAPELKSGTIDIEDKTAYQGVIEVLSAFGCEIEPTVTVGKNGVESRSLNLRKQIGADRGLRLDYRWNLRGISKKVLDEEVFSACFGYGETLSTTTNGVSDRLTFASINGGKTFVADEDALQRCGIPDGNGGARHTYGVYRNSECKDKAQLLRETREYLAQHTVPAVSYSAEPGAMALGGAQLGDVIHVVDADWDPPIRLETRIGEMTKPLDGTGSPSVTFGTVVSALPDVLVRTLKQASTALQVARVAAGAAAGITDNVTTEKVTTGSVTIEGEGDDKRGTLTVGPNGELIWKDANGVEHVVAGTAEEVA